MLNKNEILDQCKSMLKRLEPTQENIVGTADYFLVHSARGRISLHLAKLWNSMFKMCTNEQKLSYLYLANHIIQSHRKDEAQLKNALRPYLGPALLSVYKYSASQNMCEEITKLLLIWKERNIYDREFLDGILEEIREKREERSERGGLVPKSRSVHRHQLKAPKLGGSQCIVKPGSDLIELSENLKYSEEWKEKIDSLSIVLSTLLVPEKQTFGNKSLTERDEMESECKIAEYHRALQLNRKYSMLIVGGLVEMCKKLDNMHLQEVMKIQSVESMLKRIDLMKAAILNNSQNTQEICKIDQINVPMQE